MHTKKVVYVTIFSCLFLLLAGCNIPGNSSQPTTDTRLIYTSAAQTFTAQETAASQGTPIVLPSATSPVVIVPSNTALPPTDTPLPTNTLLPTDTPFPTATPTSLPPTPTLKSSPTEPVLLVDPCKIVGRVDVGGRSLFIRRRGWDPTPQ
jgi:hypothetical protein